MKTIWLLASQFEGRATLPLGEISEEYLGLTVREANRRAESGELKLATFRLRDSKRAPRIVHLQDLANLIDEMAQEARAEVRAVHGD